MRSLQEVHEVAGQEDLVEVFLKFLEEADQEVGDQLEREVMDQMRMEVKFQANHVVEGQEDHVVLVLEGQEDHGALVLAVPGEAGQEAVLTLVTREEMRFLEYRVVVAQEDQVGEFPKVLGEVDLVVDLLAREEKVHHLKNLELQFQADHVVEVPE